MAEQITGVYPQFYGPDATVGVSADGVSAEGGTPDFLARRMELERLFGELTYLEQTFERSGGFGGATLTNRRREIERVLRRAEEIESLEETLRLHGSPGSCPRSDNHESARPLVEAATGALRALRSATFQRGSTRRGSGGDRFALGEEGAA